MWAINSARHLPPVKSPSGNGWIVAERKTDDHGGLKIIAQTSRLDPFNYTFKLHDGERLTFVYDGASVKPMYRTLRKYGAEALQPIVARLANLDRFLKPEEVLEGFDLARTVSD